MYRGKPWTSTALRQAAAIFLGRMVACAVCIRTDTLDLRMMQMQRQQVMPAYDSNDAGVVTFGNNNPSQHTMVTFHWSLTQPTPDKHILEELVIGALADLEFAAIDVTQSRLNRSGMPLSRGCVLASHCVCQVTVQPRVSMDQSAVTAMNAKSDQLDTLLISGLSSFGLTTIETSEIVHVNGRPRVMIMFLDLRGDNPCSALVADMTARSNIGSITADWVSPGGNVFARITKWDEKNTLGSVVSIASVGGGSQQQQQQQQQQMSVQQQQQLSAAAAAQNTIVDISSCVDTDNGATDFHGDNCSWYDIHFDETDAVSICGTSDDDDFSSTIMCCICSGGATPSTSNTAASAVGDPHLFNVLGERFDLMQSGEHVLLLVPRAAARVETLLRVNVVARSDGSACSDMYIKAMNITGHWAKAPVAYHAGSPPAKSIGWQHFGPIDIKVAWGKTAQGTEYMNFFVRHLRQLHVHQQIGGLLGEDDHAAAARRDAKCAHVVNMNTFKSEQAIVDDKGDQASDGHAGRADAAAVSIDETADIWLAHQ